MADEYKEQEEASRESHATIAHEIHIQYSTDVMNELIDLKNKFIEESEDY